MGKLTPSKELRTVYKVLKRIHAAEQLEENHPRVCGEHSGAYRCAYGSRGSSPRMRGAPLVSPRCFLAYGIIPAYAGSTVRCRTST